MAKSVTRSVYSNNYAHNLLMKLTEGQEIVLPGTKQFAAHFKILSRHFKNHKALIFVFIPRSHLALKVKHLESHLSMKNLIQLYL